MSSGQVIVLLLIVLLQKKHLVLSFLCIYIAITTRDLLRWSYYMNYYTWYVIIIFTANYQWIFIQHFAVAVFIWNIHLYCITWLNSNSKHGKDIYFFNSFDDVIESCINFFLICVLNTHVHDSIPEIVCFFPVWLVILDALWSS